jgi:hypothetical protein
MQLILKITLILLCSASKIFAQESTDPSKWPPPSSELIKSGYYSKEKLYKYWQWRKNTLPDLFLLYNEKDIKFKELKWGKGNFQYRFTFTNFHLELIVDNQPSKKRYAEIKTLPINALDSITKIEPKALLSILEADNNKTKDLCFEIENQYRNVYLIIIENQREIIRLFKTTYCRCDFDSDGE